MLDLSVCLILKDEALRLPQLLASLPLERLEIIAADTGSSDATVAILKRAGISPFHFDWQGDFSLARNFTLAKAKRRFILWLDGDDQVDAAFWESVTPLLQGPEQAYRFTVRSPREDGSCESFKQIRLFPNHHNVQFEGRVHEQLGSCLQRLGIPIVNAALDLTHQGYASAAERNKKRDRNLKLLTLELAEHPQDPAVVLQYGNALCQSQNPAAGRTAYCTLLPFEIPGAAVEKPQDERLRHFPALIAETFEQENNVPQAEAWHRLARVWAPEYLRSGYWLARHAVEVQDKVTAWKNLIDVIEAKPHIGLVACDNEGVRRNALALAFLLAISQFKTDQVKNYGLQAKTWLRELIQGGRPPLDPKAVTDFLIAEKDWTALEAYLRVLHLEDSEDLAAMEDGAEALLLGQQGGALDRLLNFLGPRQNKSGVLEAFAGVRLQDRYGDQPRIAFHRFVQALQRHKDNPTVIGHFCNHVNQHKMYSEARYILSHGLVRGPALDDLLSQLQPTRNGALIPAVQT